MMIPSRKTNPRAEYRLRQSERANKSVSLAEKFPTLKSLTVNLEYFDTAGLRKNGEMTYKVNLHHAKSVFSFVCRNGECVGGDFDLSSVVAEAVSGRRKIAVGKLQCQGWRTKAKQNKVPCHNLLHYKLSLGYV